MPLSDATGQPFWLNVLLFLAAAAVIWVAGSRLTRQLDAVALKTKLDHAFVGMLVLGGITSLPEVANVLTSALNGNPELAANNLLGSAAINVLLLAVVDGFIGRRAVTSIVAQPSTMMMATLSMLILILIAAVITVGDVRVGPVGIGALAIGALSLFSFRLAAGYDRRSQWRITGDEDKDRGKDETAPTDRSLRLLWTLVAVNSALIFAAGYTLSQTGDAIAEQAGLTAAIVGFALIGTATSLPELVTIVMALRLKRPEMAFGQVLGTNFVNLALIPLGDAVFQGAPILNSLGVFETVSALLAAALTGIFLVGLLEHRDRRIFKMGVDSALVIAAFVIGCVVLGTV